MSKVENGQTVEVHYKGTFDDGTEFDSSHSRGESLTFTVGSGQTIAGFETGVVGMVVGEKKNISIEPQDAYGETNPEAIFEYPVSSFPEDLKLVEGANLMGQDTAGNQMMAKVDRFEGDKVFLDFNHPMAGKRLNFSVELVKIK